jgi:hypothetical protein
MPKFNPFTSPTTELLLARHMARIERLPPMRGMGFRCSIDVERVFLWGTRPTPAEEADAMFAARWADHGAKVLDIARTSPEENDRLLVMLAERHNHGRRLSRVWRKKVAWVLTEQCTNCATRLELARKTLKGLLLKDSSLFRSGLNALEGRW